MSKIHIKSFAIRYLDFSEENNPENYNPQTEVHESWDTQALIQVL